MYQTNWTSKILLLIIAGSLTLIALRPFVEPDSKALAQSARFDHLEIVSAAFLYKGEQGLLVLDRRTANVWFIARRTDTGAASFGTPVFVVRLPFDKLDQALQ